MMRKRKGKKRGLTRKVVYDGDDGLEDDHDGGQTTPVVEGKSRLSGAVPVQAERISAAAYGLAYRVFCWTGMRLIAAGGVGHL